MLLIKTIFLQVTHQKNIFQPTKYEHEGLKENIDSGDSNFSLVGLVQLLFLKRSQL